MSRSFQQRLRACQRDGNLTVADLARWFDRPYPTIRTWVNGGIEPGGGPLDKKHVLAMLQMLEGRIRSRRGFPIPRLAPAARIKHLLDLKPANAPA